MGKRKGNPNFAPDQDELDLGPSEGENGTVPPPNESSFRGRVRRITASGAASAHGGYPGVGEDADDGRIANLPAFAMDGAWYGGGMPTGFKPVRTFRLKRLILLGAIVAFAAAVGALAGSLATGALGASGNRGAAAEAPLKTALDRMEQQLAAKISDTLDRLERRGTQTAPAVAAASPDVTGAIGAPAGDAKKTPIVNGWSLYQARHGMALIEGRHGLIQVEPGDALPGLGRVETIRKQDGRWVVVTSRGLIVER
jgi:hypothetical protein